MDSSQKRSPEDVIAHLPELVRDGLSDALDELLPDLDAPLAEAAERFLASHQRLAEGIAAVAAIADPDEKKIGMALSALLLRARDLAARWPDMDAATAALLAEWTPPDNLRFPAEYLTPPDDAESLPLAAPEWDLPQGDRLGGLCREILKGWFTTGRLAIAIATIPSPECRLTFAAQVADTFAARTWPALGGEDGLLKLLPRMHEQNSGRIYREEYLSDG